MFQGRQVTFSYVGYLACKITRWSKTNKLTCYLFRFWSDIKMICLLIFMQVWLTLECQFICPGPPKSNLLLFLTQKNFRINLYSTGKTANALICALFTLIGGCFIRRLSCSLSWLHSHKTLSRRGQIMKKPVGRNWYEYKEDCV